MMGPFAAFLASCTWAVGSSTYGLLAKRYTAYSINFVRALISLPLFFVLLAFQEGSVAMAFSALESASGTTLLWLFASMIASYGLGDFFFFWSTRTIGVPRALAVASSYPLLSASAAWLFLGQKISGPRVFGLLITVVGVILVILTEKTPASPGHPHETAQDQTGRPSFRDQATKMRSLLSSYWVGVLFAFFVSMFWALNTFSISQVSGQISAVAASTIRMLMTLPLCLTYSFALKKRGQDLLLSRPDFKQFGWVFALESFCGSLSFVYGLTHTPLAIASALSGLAPVLTVPIAIWTGREVVSRRLLMGIILAAVGAWMLVALP